jgi:hypothetical protein
LNGNLHEMRRFAAASHAASGGASFAGIRDNQGNLEMTSGPYPLISRDQLAMVVREATGFGLEDLDDATIAVRDNTPNTCDSEADRKLVYP